jgi:peptidoglycan/LPS O-acetylase OafA/YrhL
MGELMANTMTQRHFSTLDGLRGIAALAVVVYHRRDWSGADLVSHSYLAVDFFFLLSGFVIAYSYERKLLEGMSFQAFVAVRLSRLYPLLIAGTLAYASYLLFMSFREGLSDSTLLQLPLALIALPDVSASTPDPFPLLPVAWSLFFELVANFIYALLLPVLSVRILACLVGASGSILALSISYYGSAEVGMTYPTLWAGLPRVAFPFFLGVLMFRCSAHLPRWRCHPLLLAGALTYIFAAPIDGWIFDAVCIALIFPAVLALGISNQPPPALEPWVRLSGDLSYPIYVLHLPVYVWAGFVLSYFKISDPLKLLICVPLILILSWIMLKVYDEPVRRMLRAVQGRRSSPPRFSA